MQILVVCMSIDCSVCPATFSRKHRQKAHYILTHSHSYTIYFLFIFNDVIFVSFFSVNWFWLNYPKTLFVDLDILKLLKQNLHYSVFASYSFKAQTLAVLFSRSLFSAQLFHFTSAKLLFLFLFFYSSPNHTSFVNLIMFTLK